MVEVIFEGEYLRGFQVAGQGIAGDNILPDAAVAGLGKLKDEDGNRKYKRMLNPDYGKLVDTGLGKKQEDTRRYIGFVLDPEDPDLEIKEKRRIEKVKAQFAMELFDLIYANKDDPAALAAALCDRVKEIDGEITIAEAKK